MYFIVLLVTVAAAAWATIILYFKHKFSYWSRRNVAHIEPRIPFGTLQVFGERMHMSQLTQRQYKELRDGQRPFGGMYTFTQPVALALELDFVKSVLIKDFSSFADRGFYYNQKDDPLSAHLFALDAHTWKGLRSKITPTFTSGKMKFMFSTIVAVADQFQQHMSGAIHTDGQVLEMKDLLARFTTDVIGSCAFGIECNSLRDPNAEFRRMGRKVFEQPRLPTGLQLLANQFKSVARMLGVKVVHDDVSNFFMGAVKETIAMRETNDVRRNDFMDLLIEMKNHGTLDGKSVGGALTLEEVAAQAFVFFLAGFETSSTTMSYALHELSLNADIQQRARMEIETVLAKHGGELSYEAMMEMHYIERIINESLRKYPPVSILTRIASEDYRVPNTSNTIEKDTMIIVPVYAIHHDPEYYPQPELFDPDRFEQEQVQARPSSAYLPFGDGPRNCIGLRFGMMQSRIGLITLLRSFEFAPSKQSKRGPLEFSAKSLVLTSTEGLHLEFKKLPPARA